MEDWKSNVVSLWFSKSSSSTFPEGHIEVVMLAGIKTTSTGRWYASAAIKVILALLITNCDINLVGFDAQRFFPSVLSFIHSQPPKVTMAPRPGSSGSEKIMGFL